MSGEPGTEDEIHEATATDDEVVALRFTVIDRRGDDVHLLCEGEGLLFGCPTISAETWATALLEVPEAWEIVDLATSHGRRHAVGESTRSTRPLRCRRHD